MLTDPVEVFGEVGEQYADFAAYAAPDSARLDAWAHGVAGDEEVVAWLMTLPEPKRQPNLVFAAARWHGADTSSYDDLRDALLGDDGSIRGTIMARATQTNEVGRLATLVPAFSMLAAGRPVSLLEVGASAGLCLYPDRWSYEWVDARGLETRLRPASATGSVTVSRSPGLHCEVQGAVPFPSVPLTVAGRAGIDLHPLDVTDEDAMAWLEILVWPEQDDRRATLRQAVDIARSDPPAIEAGDLLELLPAAVERAAAHGPVIVFHSAVIAYLTEPDRERFAATMAGLVGDGACHWVSNEGRRVLPGVSGDRDVPSGRFVLGVDGRAVAHTHGHGRSMTWFG